MVAASTKTDHLEALLQTSRALATEIHLDRVLLLIAEKAMEVFDAERHAIYLYDATTEELRSIVAHESGEIRLPITKGLAGHSARTRSTLNIRDAYDDEHFNPEFDRRSGFRTRSVLCSPIVASTDELIGVIQILNRHGGPFTADDEALLEGFCSQAAIALERARLVEAYAKQKQIETTLGLARDIQMGILPEQGPWESEGLRAYCHLRPAQTVGGDFFDIRKVDQSKLGMVIGDVSGKGIPAAMFMHGVYTILRQSLLEGTSPARCFDLIHGIHRNDSAIFVTLFYGLLDLTSGALRYANAGHHPPFLLGVDGVRALDRADNLPLCIIGPSRGFVERTVNLTPGDTLILFTDGLPEARNGKGEFYGLNRIADYLAKWHGRKTEEIATGLLDDVRQFADGEAQTDDQTLLAIQYSSLHKFS